MIEVIALTAGPAPTRPDHPKRPTPRPQPRTRQTRCRSPGAGNWAGASQDSPWSGSTPRDGERYLIGPVGGSAGLVLTLPGWFSSLGRGLAPQRLIPLGARLGNCQGRHGNASRSSGRLDFSTRQRAAKAIPQRTGNRRSTGAMVRPRIRAIGRKGNGRLIPTTPDYARTTPTGGGTKGRSRA